MASTGEVWKLGYRPALDGLRGVAVLLVVLDHLYLPGVGSPGAVGVTVFFTLSGFLITSLLLEECQEHGRIDFGNFYLRRARRLLPALAAFLFVMLTLGLGLSAAFATPGAVVAALFYGANWVQALHPGSLGGLAHTWSLSVEEQFYVAWPLIVLLIRNRAALAWVAGCGALAAVALRFMLWNGGTGAWRVYCGTDTRADALLIGCLLAIAITGKPQRKSPTPGFGVGAALLASVTGILATESMAVMLPVMAAALTALAIWSTVQGEYRGVLAASWLRLVGRRSYALYLWHFPLLWVVLPRLALPKPVTAVFLLALAWGLAHLSWRIVEKPILERARLRRAEQGDLLDRLIPTGR